MKASFQADVRTISEAFFERIAHKMMVFSYETTDSACRVLKTGYFPFTGRGFVSRQRAVFIILSPGGGAKRNVLLSTSCYDCVKEVMEWR